MRFLLSLLVFTVLSSCSLVREIEINHAINSGKHYLKKGDYRDAIITCYRSLERYPNAQKLKDACLNVFNDTKSIADQLFKDEDYTRAGLIYRFMLHYTPQSLRMDVKEIHILKNICINKLSEKALANYRKGNIKDAIASWNDILKIDPLNEEAKKSLSIASRQMENINKIQNQ